MREAEIPAAIVAAVAACKHKVGGIAAAGCSALRNLAAAPDATLRRGLVAVGAVRACVAAVSECDAAVEEKRRSAVEARDAGFDDPLLKQDEDTAEQLAWATYGALFALACEPANCGAMLREGAAEAAVAVLRRHMRSWRLCWACCGVLLRLGQCAAAAGTRTGSAEWALWETVVGGEAAGALNEVLGVHADEPRVVRAARAVMGMLRGPPAASDLHGNYDSA